MHNSINQSLEILQGQSEDVEQFLLFKIQAGLGKGIKSRIKSHNCQWNALLRGWLCPLTNQKKVQNILQEAKIAFEMRIYPFPRGMISSDPKITGLKTRLDILEEGVYKEGMQLLEDVLQYDSSLRPENFTQIQGEEGKTTAQIQIERDFHERWATLQKKKEEIEWIRTKLSHLNDDPEEKILDQNAPVKIVDSLIQNNFTSQNNRTLQYCSDSFWQWDGTHYIELNENEIRQVIYRFLMDAKKLSTAGHLENFNPNMNKVSQVIDALRSVCYQRHHPTNGPIWLDGRKGPDPKYLISFRNGLLNILDWLEDPDTKITPHSPLFLNINSLTFDFDPYAQEPKEWLRFLNAIWPNDKESQQTLQEWFGYLLIQDTRLHKILLIVGPPRSGKGTIGRVLRELLGHFNVVGPTLSSLSGEFGLQPLLGKTLALISDARLNGKSNNNIIIERLLSISGEDPLTIDRKFLQSLTVQLPTRITMMSNELPDMKDSSGALAKRYLVLTLKTSWLGNEDTSLSSRLQTELPGILLWSLQGLIRLQKRGYFMQPASASQTIEELEAMTSPIKAFIAERCVLNPLAQVEVTALFNAWRDWCLSSGYTHPGNVQSFGKKLRAAFPGIEMTRPQDNLNRERYYKGIAVASV